VLGQQFIISTLAKGTGKSIFATLNPSGTGLFLTRGRQCGQVFWWQERRSAFCWV